MARTKAAERRILARVHQATALVLGYNELAKMAPTLGERVYWRLAMDMARERAEALGAKFAFTEGEKSIVVPGAQPFIRFHERDIEEMRRVVAEHDASKKDVT